jgi:hypothetical protein
MIRHRYKKEAGRDGVCAVCNQGRSEALHALLVWKKAPSGNWVSNAIHDAPVSVYRCREVQDGQQSRWIPEAGVNPDWLMLTDPTDLADAKAVCESDREERESHAVR